jgi:hypothetical protein
MGELLCIGGIDIDTLRSVRLLPPGGFGQPKSSPLRIGEIWEADYTAAVAHPPHMDDVTVTFGERVALQSVERFVNENNIDVVAGDSTALFEGRLQWTTGRTGYMEPDNASNFSTTFWRPNDVLWWNDPYVREQATNHRVKWVGVDRPGERIQAGTLCRMSLTRPFHGSLDHDVNWLQISGIY